VKSRAASGIRTRDCDFRRTDVVLGAMWVFAVVVIGDDVVVVFLVVGVLGLMTIRGQ
jgi:hypothetical protein